MMVGCASRPYGFGTGWLFPFKRTSHIFIQENAFENIVSEMAAVSSRPQCVKNVFVNSVCKMWTILFSSQCVDYKCISMLFNMNGPRWFEAMRFSLCLFCQGVICLFICRRRQLTWSRNIIIIMSHQWWVTVVILRNFHIWQLLTIWFHEE